MMNKKMKFSIMRKNVGKQLSGNFRLEKYIKWKFTLGTWQHIQDDLKD